MKCGGTRVEKALDRVGWVGRGRKACKRITASEKYVYPRMAPLISAAWLHWLTVLTSSYQNPRAKQCEHNLQSERSKRRKVRKILSQTSSVNWRKLFFKRTSPDNSGNSLYSHSRIFRLTYTCTFPHHSCNIE